MLGIRRGSKCGARGFRLAADRRNSKFGRLKLQVVPYQVEVGGMVSLRLLSQATRLVAPVTVTYIAAVEQLLVTIRLGIADSIMVFHIIFFVCSVT